MNYTPTISKDQLEHGSYYAGRCRNASEARWNEEKKCFYHWRTKFGNTFIETIKAPEDEEHYDVFVTSSKLDTPTKEIPFED